MAEENTEEMRLFELLNQPNLTDEQKGEIKTLLDGHPERLVSEAFMARFDIPDMKGGYKTPEDLQMLLDKSLHAQKTIHTVLDNLKKLNEEGVLQKIENNGVEKNPSAYLLDNAYLPNGELVGTQMAKNISFMKDLQKNEKGDLTPAQVAQITEHKDKNNTLLFQKLYDKENGYGANSNRRNKNGEKVTDVMRLSVIAEKKYRGQTLTAEEQKVLEDKDRKDAPMNAIDGDEKRHEPKKHKDKFKDEDVIKYLYEDVFLEGLSWIFDKIEDGITIVVDTAVDDFRNMIASYKKDNAEMKDKRLDAAKKKVMAFNDGFTNEFNGLNSTIAAKRKAYAETLKDLRDNIDHPTPELKEKFGAEFVEKLTKDPNKDKFFGQAEKIVSGELEYLYTTSGLGLRLARVEMVDEFMHDDKSWRKKKSEHESEQESKHEYKTDEALQTKLRQNAVKHQQDIREAFVAEAERVRAVTESDYALLESNEYKKRFYAAVIPTGKEGDDLRRRMAEVEDINNKELTGTVLGDEDKVKRAKFEQEIFALYGQKAANAYLKQVADLVKEAEDKQKDLDKDGRYDVCGKAPKNEVRSVLGEVESLNKQTKQKAVDDGKIFDELPKDLKAKNEMYEGVGSVMDLESAGKIEGKEVFAKAQVYSDLQTAKVEQAALHNRERKKAFKQRAEQIVQRNKARQFQKDVMLGVAGMYQTDRYTGR